MAVVAMLQGAPAEVAEARALQVGDTRESAERQLRSILSAPDLATEPSVQYKGPLTVPPASDEALRARKDETLRRFEEQQRLDVERDLRDRLRQ
jgi:hypothetical protein